MKRKTINHRKTSVQNREIAIKKHESKTKWKEGEEACLGCVKPDQIERVEIERRIRTVENGPGTELSGSKARYDDAGKLGVVAVEIAGGDGT